MLDTIEQIDWAALGHPDVPDLLHKLVSDDPQQRIEAERRLDWDILQGGDWQSFDLGKGIEAALRTELPVHLVPVLLALLSSPAVHDIGKRLVLGLLSTMLWYRKMYYAGEIYKQRALRVEAAIWAGNPIFTTLLSNPDIDIRKATLDVMFGFTNVDYRLAAYEIVARTLAPVLPPRQQHTPGLHAHLGPAEMSDDFNDELPDDFWFGDT